VVENEEGEEQTWRIFGVDEVNVECGVLSWKSPLARALIGKREGDSISFRAPAGVRELEVLSVEYIPQKPIPSGELDWQDP
jgi:transcription elongation GreA/GreB family factor